MKKLLTPGRITLGIFLLLAAFAVAAWQAPQVEATAWREPLRAELSRALGRDVTFRDVRYTLFPYPGLTASDLLIPEDPSFGIEPFAYVTEFQVGLRWTSLLVGRFEISTVRMSEPSVNLSHRDGAGWNAGRLLEHLRNRVAATGSAPRMVLENGRINFRERTLKSPFFLNAVDLDLSPPSRSTGSLEWNFEASPARTDRSEQGFGRFTGQGLWRPAEGREGRIEVEMELERSIISEVATLVTGNDLGLQGRISSRLRIDGPPSDLGLRGVMELEGLGRGGLLSARDGAWTLNYQGKINAGSQWMEISTVAPKDGAAAPPLNLTISAESLLTSPRWQANVAFEEVRATHAIQLAQRLGARVPDGLEVDGTLRGALDLPRHGAASGSVELSQATVRMRGAGPVTIPQATLRLAGGVVELLPAEMESPSKSPLSLSGKWSAATEALSFVVGLKELPLDELRSAAEVIPGAPSPPLLDQCAQGRVSGEVRFARESGDEPAPWAGELNLVGPVCSMPGSAEPLNVTRASIAFRGEAWTARRVTAQWGRLIFDATADYRAAVPRPLRLALDFRTLDASEVERLLLPALSRRRGFLDRTFRRRAAVPEWLAERRIEAVVKSRDFILGSHSLHRLSAHVFWDGTRIDVPSLDAFLGQASFSGRLAADLTGETPAYQVLGRVSGLDWQSASVDSDVDARTSGLGSALPRQLHAEGVASTPLVEIDGERYRNAAACFDYDARRPAGQQWRLRCLEAMVDGDVMTGAGSVSVDGRVVLDLASQSRTLRLGGAVWPFTLDALPGAAAQSR